MKETKYRPGKCKVCATKTVIRYIDLYVFGSEGLHICIECEREITDNILNLTFEKQSQRQRQYLKKRALRRQNESDKEKG